MLLWTCCKQILFYMWRHKLRSAMALFGVAWGALAVLLLLAIGNGFAQASQSQLQSLASGLQVAHSGRTSMSYQGRPAGQDILISTTEVNAFAQQTPAAKISPMLGGRPGDKPAMLIHGRKHASYISIQGVNSLFASMTNMQLSAGSRFFSPLDIKQQAHVAIISAQIKQELFGKKNALGQLIYIAGVPFRVIGILKKGQQHFEGSGYMEQTAYIPYTTYSQVWGTQTISRIYLLPANPDETRALMHTTREHFSMLKKFSMQDKPAFDIPDGDLRLSARMQHYTHYVQLFLAGCGMLTLAVAGISIANLMFLMITERTREIGLYMALGARSYFMQLQIMLEGCVIVLGGGLIGLACSFIILSLARHIGLPSYLGQPHLGATSIGLVGIILLIMALAASYAPAQRAARMQPVTALAF